MSRLKISSLLFLMYAISACSLFNPYVDRRREAGVRDPAHLYIGASTPEEPAICYNAWATPYSEVKKMAEDCKVAIRNARRDAIEGIRKLKNDKQISEDIASNAEKDVDKDIAKFIESVDRLSADKEKDIMSV